MVSTRHPPPVHSNVKVLVFWTESFEDQLQLPLSEFSVQSVYSYVHFSDLAGILTENVIKSLCVCPHVSLQII